MVRLKLWQWIVLAAPIASIAAFLLVAAGFQIQQWGASWVWAIVVVLLLGWRWLLVKWTEPAIAQLEAAVSDANAQIEAATAEAEAQSNNDTAAAQVREQLQEILEQAREDAPFWEDWQAFWGRSQSVVVAVANAYSPDVKYPLLNIYVPQAYGLVRGTVDDLDRWMQKLAPVLGQVTVGQAYRAYEMYQQIEPSARKLGRVWRLAQWFVNPAAAVARQATRQSSDRATQQLASNLGQLLREAALRNLCQQAIRLYGNTELPELTDIDAEDDFGSRTLRDRPLKAQAQSQTLRNILDRAEPVEQVDTQPVNLLLVGRTGAGKSSLVNTLFRADRAEVDVLPSTDKLRRYVWQAESGERLTLWDSPGYEQAKRPEFREAVLDRARRADLLLLVTPALDPALQMDADFLQDVAKVVPDLPAIALVTQVDRLRPIREWEPPYDWKTGDRPKEMSIREATAYRREQLQGWCKAVCPIVTRDAATGRTSWNVGEFSQILAETLDPAKQLRLVRFLRDRDLRIRNAARIIDRYTRQMATTQGLATFFKSPVLQFLSTLTTGQPTLAYLLAEQIPVEQLPVVIGKLQMAYDLFSLLSDAEEGNRSFDLLALWPLLLDNPDPPERNAWAFGHAVVEYWLQDLSTEQFRDRFKDYFERYATERSASSG